MTEQPAEPLVLPRRSQIEPFVGYKEVSLKLERGKLLLSGHRGTYSSSIEVATCEQDAKCTDAPNPDCECGLYAYGERSRVYSPTILATVELFGKVIVHELGFRSSHQRIVALEMQSDCDACALFNDGRRRADGFYFGVQAYRAQALCHEHGELAMRLNAAMRFTSDDIARAFGVETTWLP